MLMEYAPTIHQSKSINISAAENWWDLDDRFWINTLPHRHRSMHQCKGGFHPCTICKPLDPCCAGCNLIQELGSRFSGLPQQLSIEAVGNEGLRETIAHERHESPSMWTQTAWVLTTCRGSRWEFREERFVMIVCIL